MLYEIIEELYDKRFADETEFVRKSMNRFIDEQELCAPENFSVWVYRLYIKRFSGNAKLAESKLIALIASLEAVYTYWEQFNLFFQFVNELYDKTDLNCFLLLRSLVKKDLDEANRKSKSKRKQLQLYNYPLLPKRCTSYLNEIFKESQSINVELIMRNMLVMLKKQSSTDHISAYDFLSFTTREYRAIRDKKHIALGNSGYLQAYLTKSGPVQEDQPKHAGLSQQAMSVREFIREEMKKLVSAFVDTSLAEELGREKHQQSIVDAKELIMSKLDNFLTAIFNSNKVLWFKELMVEDPEEDHLAYVEDLFKQYRRFSMSRSANQEEYKEFCKKIFKTPEVIDQISSLLAYIIEGNSVEESIFKASQKMDYEVYEDQEADNDDARDEEEDGYQSQPQSNRIFEDKQFETLRSEQEYVEDAEQVMETPMSFGKSMSNALKEGKLINKGSLHNIDQLEYFQSHKSSRHSSEKVSVKGLESFGRKHESYKADPNNLEEWERLYEELEVLEKEHQDQIN